MIWIFPHKSKLSHVAGIYSFTQNISQKIISFLNMNCCLFCYQKHDNILETNHWLISILKINWNFQKQLLRGVPRKRCSENMQQIYKRTPMPKCDFKEHLLLRTPLGGCFWSFTACLINLWTLRNAGLMMLNISLACVISL